jgi:hypothetical protein
LEKFRHDFIVLIKPKCVGVAIDSNVEALGRLIGWSERRQDDLQARGPDGRDPLVGVVERKSGVFVWRVYPRKGDGAKVTLLPRCRSRLSASEARAVTQVLERLHPGLEISATGQLEIALWRIAPDTQWREFERVLDLVVSALTRTVMPRQWK